jgi:hypothetical protein
LGSSTNDTPPPATPAPPCFSSLFLPDQRLREGHGACGVRLTPAGCQGLGSGAAALISPHFILSSCGGQGGNPPWGGGSAQGELDGGGFL